MKKFKFNAIIEQASAQKNTTFIRLPFDSKKEFGTAGTISIKADIEGIEFREAIIPIGGGIYILRLKKGIIETIGKKIGDNVNVSIEKDNDVRTIDLPKDFKIVLEKNYKAIEIFNKMPYSHQEQYVEYINEAKKKETRRKRIDKTIEMIVEWEKK